jgi:hypothetical protein
MRVWNDKLQRYECHEPMWYGVETVTFRHGYQPMIGPTVYSHHSKEEQDAWLHEYDDINNEIRADRYDMRGVTNRTAVTKSYANEILDKIGIKYGYKEKQV